MNILFFTSPGDSHCIAAKVVLESRGHNVKIITLSDLCSQTFANISIDSAGNSQWSIRDRDGVLRSKDYEVGVLRKLAPAIAPSILAEQDRKFAAREIKAVQDSLYFLAESHLHWINSPYALAKAISKPFQLYQAGKLGFQVPETLISNDFDQIIDFCKQYGPRIASKSFFQARWISEDEGYSSNMTRLVDAEQLSEYSDALAASPTIFQEYIPKQYEVRVVVMGNTCFAAAIDSQGSDVTRTDWRAHALAGEDPKISRITLPSDIEQLCYTLMGKLNITTGSFDFIVTPDDRYVFLEVNPSGQFFWMEQVDPDFPLLSAYCDFVVAKDPHFVWKESEPVAYSDIAALPEFEVALNDSLNNSTKYTPSHVYKSA